MGHDRILDLTEYAPLTLPASVLPEAVGLDLWRRFGSQIDLEFPSIANDRVWRLTSKGWVGFIPLSVSWGLRLQPRVPIGNLFRMLEYAYRLKSFRLLDGSFDCDSLEDIYDRLAGILAGRVLDRARQGYYRAYVSRREELALMRGRLEVATALRRPWAATLPCEFQEHTADVEDNQLLAWTLSVILRHGICSSRTAPRVRQAFNSLRGAVTLGPFRAEDCCNRRYHRLNQDYELLHALCRFFLEEAGPRHDQGEHPMQPFLVWMPGLFEQFVAAWLEAWLPEGWEARSQEEYPIDLGGQVKFVIDLVLYDREGVARLVIDTKYKTPSRPATDDIAQVVAYAQAKGCVEAVLLYPQALDEPLDGWVGDVRVRSIAFGLQGDLEASGRGLLRAIGIGDA